MSSLITYIGAATQNVASGNVATFAAQPIGSASADRLVVVAILTEWWPSDITGVTIGGQAATIHAQGNTANNWGNVAIASASIAAGTTADIAVTVNGGVGHAFNAAVAVYAITGLSSATPTGTSGIGGTAVLAPSVAVDAGGIAVGIGCGWDFNAHSYSESASPALTENVSASFDGLWSGTDQLSYIIGEAHGLSTGSYTVTYTNSSTWASAALVSWDGGATGSIASATGTASGQAAVTGVPMSLAASAGTASGISAAAGDGSARAASAGASAGVSAVSGVGSSLVTSSGAAAGLAAVSGAGSSLAASVGSAIATASAAAIGAARAAGCGIVAAYSTAVGISSFEWGGSTGTAVGHAFASATGAAISRAAGTAAGTAVVYGRGIATSAAALSNNGSVARPPLSHWIARACIKRKWTATMAVSPDLTPPIDVGEQRFVAFDFAREVPHGATIGTPVVTCALVSGSADATPAARVIGAAIIAPSPETGAAAQAVNQLIGGMVSGTYYELQCLVNASDGSRPSIIARVRCR
jgi:hypothetical protein